MQADYDELFPVLNTQPEIEVLVNPFVTAYQNDAMEQLEGQVASAKSVWQGLLRRNYIGYCRAMILRLI